MKMLVVKVLILSLILFVGSSVPAVPVSTSVSGGSDMSIPPTSTTDQRIDRFGSRSGTTSSLVNSGRGATLSGTYGGTDLSGIEVGNDEPYGGGVGNPTQAIAPTVVPEPTGLILLGMGLAGAGVARKLRRRHRG